MTTNRKHISEIELFITDCTAQLWYKGHHFFDIAVWEDGVLTVGVANLTDMKFLRQSLSSHLHLDKLDIFVITKEKQPEGFEMALPRRSKRKAKTEIIEAPRAPKKQYASQVETIPEAYRDKVLTALLDSLLDQPDQSKTLRSAETKRIANKYNEGIYVVAGVRAALTRGSYGDPDKLLAQRRKERTNRTKS